MAKDKEKELKEIYDKVESRNRKIARVPTAHFPPFDTVVPTPTEHDPVNHPSHYNQFGIECLDAIEASMTPVEFRGYLKGNCQKYIWRYVYKGKPVEDLKKASFYLNKLIEKVEENGV